MVLPVLQHLWSSARGRGGPRMAPWGHYIGVSWATVSWHLAAPV